MPNAKLGAWSNQSSMVAVPAVPEKLLPMASIQGQLARQSTIFAASCGGYSVASFVNSLPEDG